ncbi:MAG: lipid II flippase MurJ [Anaerolineales bacterium]|nr:lipid II flippase MurJ [Anaerolineales bacterium]
MKKLSHLTRTSLLLSFFFALDKGLAFIKSMLFNKIVGLEGMGIFAVSNNIPDYLSALISGGALGMAFIPVLTEYLDREGRQAAWNLFSRIINLAFIVTAALSVVIILLADPLVRYIIAPGFQPDKQTLTISLMRLDLVAILIFSISGLIMAGLQANKHFFLPAMAPVLYNLGQIFGVTVLSPSEGLHLGPFQLPALGLGLYGMVYGVILGAALHLLIQVPGLLRYQFRWTPVIGLRNTGVQRVLVLLGPRVLTMACIQAYFLSRDSLASHFGEAGVGALNLGWTIQQVPETIIGTAIAIALLPSLSEYVNRGQSEAFRQTVNRALRVMLALCLPAAALLALGVRPLAMSFFHYDSAQLDLLTACTWAFLLGLLGDTWLEVAVRSFYANQNTRTPLIAALIQAVSFFFLARILSTFVGLYGIPLAAALTFSAQAFVLLYLLDRRYPGLLQVGHTLARAVLAAGVSALLAFLLMNYLPLPVLPLTLVALMAGGLAALPVIWPEVRLLFSL